MRRMIAASLLLVAALAMPAMAKDTEAMKLGDRVAPFPVTAVTGPKAGDTLCYRCMLGNAPVVAVFTRTLDDKFVGVVKNIDAQMKTNDNLQAFVVYLSDDAKKAGEELAALNKTHSFDTPLTTFTDSKGPAAYKIASDAKIAVRMWVNGSVKSTNDLAGNESAERIAEVTSQTNTILQ